MSICVWMYPLCNSILTLPYVDIGMIWSESANGSNQLLQSGDKVRISPAAKDKNGCLGRPEYGFVGTINSISGNSVSVTCWDAKGSPYESQVHININPIQQSNNLTTS